MNSENKDGIKPLLKLLFPKMIVANVPVWLITLIWGFDLTMIIGLAVGTLYAIISYIYLANTINKSVVNSVGRAKWMMMRCYLVRMFLLCFLGYVALKYDFMNFVGLLLPQFYPKIILTIMNFTEKKNNFSMKGE